jgi:hypothetical protein
MEAIPHRLPGPDTKNGREEITPTSEPDRRTACWAPQPAVPEYPINRNDQPTVKLNCPRSRNFIISGASKSSAARFGVFAESTNKISSGDDSQADSPSALPRTLPNSHTKNESRRATPTAPTGFPKYVADSARSRRCLLKSKCSLRRKQKSVQHLQRHCQLKTLRDILSWERCGSCARLGRGHFPPDRE